MQLVTGQVYGGEISACPSTSSTFLPPPSISHLRAAKMQPLSKRKGNGVDLHIIWQSTLCREQTLLSIVGRPGL